MGLQPAGADPAKLVQLTADGAAARPESDDGSGTGQPYAGTIQRLFGQHDVGDAKRPGDDAHGAPPAHVRSRVEQATDTNLGDVRIHEGPGASDAARSTGAFASGSDVFLGSQSEGPGVPSRERLIAHELVHTAQQRSHGAPHNSIEDAEREADADAALAGQTLVQSLGSAPRGVPQRATPPYDNTHYPIPPLPSGYTLANITSELKKQQSGTPPAIKSCTTAGVKSGSTEEIYVLYAVWQLAKADRWGTEADLVTEVSPGKKGSIQVTIDAAGNATGTLVAARRSPTRTPI